jgi:hypothetical protein
MSRAGRRSPGWSGDDVELAAGSARRFHFALPLSPPTSAPGPGRDGTDFVPMDTSIAHLIFNVLMGFISFGGVLILFASVISLSVWILRQLMR